MGNMIVNDLNVYDMQELGLYTEQTIEEFDDVSCGIGDLCLTLTAVDKDRTYKNVFLFSLDAPGVVGYTQTQRLLGVDEALTVEHAKALIGMSRLNLDVAKLLEVIDGENNSLMGVFLEKYHSVIYDPNNPENALLLGYNPNEVYKRLIDFATFGEEKEFWKTRKLAINIWPWGHPRYMPGGVEEDIRSLVTDFNRLSFAYTNWWSHSGTPKDHFSFGEMSMRILESAIAIDKPHVGYIAFRADLKNPDFYRFKEDIEKLPDCSIKQRNKCDGDFLMIAEVETTAIERVDFKMYQEDLDFKWAQIHHVVRNYLG